MPYPNEHSARVKEPGSFDPKSFKSKEIKPGVRIIMGKLSNGNGSMVAQAYRFSVDKFTVAEAKKWLKDNNISYISFEAAKNESEIKHVGILGMKWGQRKRVPSPDHTTAKELRKKRTYELSNAELQKVITRAQLVKQYKDIKKSNTRKGADLVGKGLKSFGKQAAAIVITAAAVKYGGKIAKALFGGGG